MAVTLGQLKTRILFDTNRDAGTYGAAVQAAIVTAISYMQNKYFWKFKKSGQVIIPDRKNSVQLPEDYQNMLTVQFTIGNTLYSLNQSFLNKSFEDLIALFDTTAQVGTPQCYAIFNNVLYVYPLVPGDTTFNIYYCFKDAFLPDNDADTSIWFDSDTVDLIRIKAMELFYQDTLQSPESAAPFSMSFKEFEKNLAQNNNNKQQYNMLSV